MNLQNVKQKLEKVNRFYDYLNANQEIISRVDHDALIASIRELYDACFDEATAKVATTSTQEVHKTTTPTQKTREKEAKKRPKLVFNTADPSPTTEKTGNEVTPNKSPKSTVKEEPIVEQPKETTPTETKPAVEQETPKAEKQVETPKDSTTSTAFNEDYEELFIFKEATDLSQKLSATPLSDLNKALGLNEKFLYINELFGGDVAKFQAAIKVLNDEKDFDSARLYIESELADTYNWMKKVKKPIAKDFVKLVRRRYL
ncbi:hypothetical protein [Aureispira sp. CCB-QB1]|uniref:hypothetical protein n=1 Tax=Aureispira sp. CCB-QB1 TaxID=1313421 RepID=UPI00069851C2|nr:hypothetical protein [Aureispira sp. CCB-QB1]